MSKRLTFEQWVQALIQGKRGTPGLRMAASFITERTVRRVPIRQMAEALYDDEELISAIVADAEANQTAGKIEAGELVLPGAQDARIWHDRKMGRLFGTDSERKLEARVRALEQLLADMVAAKKSDDPVDPRKSDEYTAALEKRIRELTSGDTAEEKGGK